MPMLRTLCWILAVFFFGATVLHFVDQLNLYAVPPTLPESSNMVERALGSFDYKQAIWPIFFGSNLLFGLGLLTLVPLAFVIGARVPRTDDRRSLLTSTLAAAGLLGAAGQLILIGAVRATVDIAYCDCGFKDQEVVSQIWAQMLIEGAVGWLLNGTAILAAIGLWTAGNLLRARGMGEGWQWLSRAIAVVLLIPVLLSILGTGDEVANLLIGLATGILLPIWAIWLGRNLGATTVLDA